MKVRKAVIAAAGFGTRFLPQTKAMPKEMLPIIDKPIIQYVVEELVEAGIEDIIIVSGYSKRSIEDHFDGPSGDLIANLQLGGPSKEPLLKEIEAISNLANFIYIRQKGPYGNATPVMNAAHLIGDEPFIYTYADEFTVASPSRFQQMVSMHDKLGGSIVPCITVSRDEDYKRYGIVAGEQVEPGVLKMNTIVEKPGKDNAPSNMASVSGYLFEPSLLKYLDEAQNQLKEGEEFYIQPAMQKAIDAGEALFACEIQNGRYCDTGNKLEYLKTVVYFALTRDDMKDDFAAYLRELKL